MKKASIIYILTLVFAFNANSIEPRKVIGNIQLSITDADNLQENGYNTLHLDFTKGIREKNKTAEGSYKGFRFWKFFNIEVSNGKIENGFFIPDYNNLNDSGKVEFTISSKNSYEKSKKETVYLPVLKKIDFKIENDKNIGIGSTLDIQLNTLFSNNKRYLIDNRKKITGINLNDYNIYADNVKVDNWQYTIPASEKGIKKYVAFKLVNNLNPNIVVNYKMTIDYNVQSSIAFEGASGDYGTCGSNGGSRSDGQNGGSGTDGLNGSKGSKGQTIIVIAKTFYLDSFLMSSFIIKESTKKYTIIANTESGRVNLASIGGKGGKGGHGGDGGSASLPSSSCCNTCSVSGGAAGDGGDGGQGGDGGNIYIYTDSVSLPHIKKVLHVSNYGGEGGDGGHKGSRGWGDERKPKDQKATFLDVLLSSNHKGSRGANGDDGVKGANGIIEWQILDSESLNLLFKQ